MKRRGIAAPWAAASLLLACLPAYAQQSEEANTPPLEGKAQDAEPNSTSATKASATSETADGSAKVAPTAAPEPMTNVQPGERSTKTANDRPATENAASPAATETAPEDVEEIMVYSRKRAEPLSEVPGAVTAFHQKYLERAEVRDLQDLEGLVPNVIIDRVPAASGGGAISIRGINFQDLEKSFEPSIGVILDGIYIGTNTTQLLNSFDFESVEILRGPQGTLFGRNTIGGIINVRRTRPTGRYGFKTSATVGSYGRRDYKAVVNFPIAEGLVAGKVSGYWLNYAGPFTNQVTSRHTPQQDYMSGTLDLLLTPTDDFEVLIKYELARDRSEILPWKNASQPWHSICAHQADINGDGVPDPLTTLSQPYCDDPKSDPYDVSANFPIDIKLDMRAVTVQATQKLGDYELAYVGGWRAHHENIKMDLDDTAENFFSSRRPQEFSQLSEELRLSGTPFEELYFVVGGYYFRMEYELDGQNYYIMEQPIVAGAPAGTVRTLNVSQVTESLAAFGQVDWEFLKGLRASVGGRYTYDEKRFRADNGLLNVVDPTIGFPREPGVRAAEGWGQLTPRAGLDYRLPEAVIGRDNFAMSYVSYSRGFKSGGFNGRADPATAETFDPETVDSFEAGLKTEWQSGRYRFNVAAFWSTYHDKQEEVILPSEVAGQQTLTRNAAQATIKGLEAELSIMPLRGHVPVVGRTRFWANGSLLDAKYDEFLADLNGLLDGKLLESDQTDMELRKAPAWQYAVGISNPYDFDWGRLILDVQYRRRAEVRLAISTDLEDQPDERAMTRALGLLDASATLELPELAEMHWRLTVFGRNLTDEVTPNAYLSLGGLGAFDAVGFPREFGLELQASY